MNDIDGEPVQSERRCYSLGQVQTRFRLASSSNIPSEGYVGDGEVEDYLFNVTDPGTTAQHSNHYTAAFEDNWPEVGDFDLNDVVVYYRTTILSKDDAVLRMDITGTIMAYGASYGNGLGWKLDGFDDSDPSSNKYYRTTQNMPWGILISSPWNHPSEYIDIDTD